MDADEARADEAKTIGARAGMIRRRRGLSLEVVAGLAGFTAQYLSMLERGERGFNRRGLLEDLAAALCCSVADLTGQPYLPMDRETAAAAPAISEISLALHNATLDDVPDLRARPLPGLVEAAARANMHRDNARYVAAGQGLGAVLSELQVWAVTGRGDDRRAALAALAEGCLVAYLMARRTGRTELAMMIAERGYEAARRAERPDLAGLMQMNRSGGFMGLGARWRASSVCTEALGDVSALPGPTPDDTRAAEARGMLLLTAGLVAARDGRPDDTATYLTEARDLASYIGERNHMRFHFGPTNVAAWELGLAVESGTGLDAAERFVSSPIDFSVFASKEREADVTFDLARAWAQAEGDRDNAAVRAVDTADRLAPLRMRNDPIAKDLVRTLDRRAPRRTWELDSLCNRFGIRSARA
ncbi:MAG: helix-turn-helix domain-containing protein [Pseudonocardiaceae bacterium]